MGADKSCNPPALGVLVVDSHQPALSNCGATLVAVERAMEPGDLSEIDRSTVTLVITIAQLRHTAANAGRCSRGRPRVSRPSTRRRRRDSGRSPDSDGGHRAGRTRGPHRSARLTRGTPVEPGCERSICGEVSGSNLPSIGPRVRVADGSPRTATQQRWSGRPRRRYVRGAPGAVVESVSRRSYHGPLREMCGPSLASVPVEFGRTVTAPKQTMKRSSERRPRQLTTERLPNEPNSQSPPGSVNRFQLVIERRSDRIEKGMKR